MKLNECLKKRYGVFSAGACLYWLLFFIAATSFCCFSDRNIPQLQKIAQGNMSLDCYIKWNVWLQNPNTCNFKATCWTQLPACSVHLLPSQPISIKLVFIVTLLCPFHFSKCNLTHQNPNSCKLTHSHVANREVH